MIRSIYLRITSCSVSSVSNSSFSSSSYSSSGMHCAGSFPLLVWIARTGYFAPFCALGPGFSADDIGATATVSVPVRSTTNPD
jgi:hypothetical protein